MIKVLDGSVKVSKGEDLCPQCESRSISGSQMYVSKGVTNQECSCHECACEWTLSFSLSTIMVTADGEDLSTEHPHHS